MHQHKWHAEAIIADTLKREPEVKLASSDGAWRFSRWRQFVGSYTLPALPDPMFVVQLAGKTNVRTWERDGWSETASYPGAATIVPATMATRWLVDGELDVVTLSIDSGDLRAASGSTSSRGCASPFPIRWGLPWRGRYWPNSIAPHRARATYMCRR
ncbi:hypothetical protein ACWGM0_20915 (plasmid) [Sphingomonas bisphenolicum]